MSLDPYFEPGDGGDNAFTVEAPKIKFGPGSLREIGDDAKALGLTRSPFTPIPRWPSWSRSPSRLSP